MTNFSARVRMCCGFDPDEFDRPAVALRLSVEQNNAEQEVHQHAKGQLILALHGAVTCKVPDGLWLVPPNHGVWIPGGTPHSNLATENARLYFLFIQPGAAKMPAHCCTLALSPLIRELIVHFSSLSPSYSADSPSARLVNVLLEQIMDAPVERLHLPISQDAKIQRIAVALAADPADRATVAEWASRLAMSERTLARLVTTETGLTFGRWRQQLQILVALRQLAEGRSVQQVAGALGYESVTAFITMFKKRLGQAPGQYLSGMG